MHYFTVGPTEMYPRFQEFLADALERDIPSLSHRSDEFYAIMRDAREALVPLLRVPQDRAIFYAGSATEWMERAVENMSARTTLHFVSGTFSERFYAFAQEMGRDAYKVLQRADGSFSLDDAPAGFNPELVALTHNETSNGTMLASAFLASVRAAYPKALIALDVVSSAPVYSDSFADVDMLFFSSQKGFGLPAGLGVALVSPAAIEKSSAVAQAGVYTGGFHAFAHLAQHAVHDRTPETPNVLGIYLLGRVARDLLSVGIETLRTDTARKAQLIYDTLERSVATELEHDAAYRSLTTIVAATPSGSAPIIERLKNEGFLIHTGYGERKDSHIRIANFAAHTMGDVERLCALL
ncbi:aminotransferase class V-fold PLP-dependent enzyme [Candidatus Kaiserbacteria bacterium]|nr:aminotransferase class V-fold PLP-dependent enzyme [Candidatus Kaiserbacteria bacterium]